MSDSYRPRRSRKLKPGDPLVTIGAMLLVVAGVVALAFFSSKDTTKTSTTGNANSVASTASGSAPVSSVPTVPAGSPSTVVILLNQDSATFLHLDGSTERIPRGQLMARLASSTLPTEGIDVGNGESVPFPVTGLDPGSVPAPDGKHAAHLADPRADGATAIILSTPNGQSSTVVLREGNTPLRDGSFAGWFDPSTMAVVAYTETTKAVYTATLDGALLRLVTLPDNVTGSTVQAGAFWYMTAVLGQGIELPPQGPSELHRVTLDDKDVTMARESAHVITTVVAEDSARAVYMTDDGRSVLIGLNVPKGQVDLGQRHVVALLPDGRIVLRTGFSLVLYDPTSGVSTNLADLPEGDVQAFVTQLAP